MPIKQKIAAYICAILIIMGLVVYFVIMPSIYDIRKISESVYAERVDLEKKYVRGQLLRKTIEDFESIKSKEPQLDSIFLHEGEELAFITTLENIAGQFNLKQGIELKSIKDSPLVKGYYALPLTLTVTGDVPGVLQYIQALEQLNYYTAFKQLVITSDGSSRSSKGFITAQLSGTAFALPIEKK